jgi:TPR repeat protein
MLGSDALKSFWKIAVFVSCVILICGAAITWHVVKARASQRKLAEDAREFRARAEQGDSGAQFNLARMYYYGKGVPQDYTEAAGWYRKAADQGDAKAEFNLSDLYLRGEGVPKDYDKAFRWCRKAAEQGSMRAQDGLAVMFYEGQGIPQDYAQAAGWHRRAADQGDSKAEYDLGFMYYKGKGVPQDYSEALLWYRKAADQNYAEAQYAVGYMYSQGKGVPQDRAEAARWYRKAAKQGDEYAQRALRSSMGFTTWSKINLSIVFLGSTLLLIDSRGSIRSRIQRRTTQTGLLGLLWVGLDAFEYSNLGIVQSVSVVSALYFGRHLLAGICVAMLASIAWPRGTKTVLGISVILFVAFDLFALAHYDLRHLVPAIRLFYLVNGLSVGVAIPSSVFLWLERKGRGKQQ